MDKFNPELVSIVAKHYEISRAEAKQRIEMYHHFRTGIDTLTDVLTGYGKTQKEIKKLLK